MPRSGTPLLAVARSIYGKAYRSIKRASNGKEQGAALYCSLARAESPHVLPGVLNINHIAIKGSRVRKIDSLLFTFLSLLPGLILAADQPQWGQPWSRNMVSGEKNLPDTFDIATGMNIKWTAALGTESYSTPIVANGRVYIGTNNAVPRDTKHIGDRGVLMCLDEKTGALLWQLVVPKRWEDPYFDWPKTGICSTATVENDRVYIVDNRGEVLCLDALGMSNGNDGPFKDEAAHMTAAHPDSKPPKAGAEIKPEPLAPPADGKLLEVGPLDADILWICDLVTTAGIWPHDAAHSSILIYGDYLYLNTGTGVDNTHRRIRTPDAPSLVVVDKKTGRLLARDNEHIAPNIFHNTWSSPAMGVVNGKPLIFFAGGNGIVYGFEPLSPAPSSNGGEGLGVRGGEVATLKKVFQFDFDPDGPKEDVHRFTTNHQEGPSNIYGMPVFANNRLYVAGGGDVFWGKNQSWLKCIDVGAAALLPPLNGGAPPSNGTAISLSPTWSCPLGKHTLSTPAIQDGLAYVTDSDGTLHCIDEKSGSIVWQHKMNGQFWASPMVADGKVYAGTRKGQFCILAAGREKKVLCTTDVDAPVSATTTIANGTLYIATMKQLFAIKK
ncbi:MAG TPA: PQQ-binding-like beta-propeller repeat protein [Planctomycetota bacterium]|nr:PQQ-binding-like beta-propeller repeat protein [Planctomycetota bacterium]